ncbi:hypothetical protein BN1182_CU_00580 [Pantoea ananatis]|nr:hypothetical protein BN1182_CU_00580 [Pantoea ananatis]
MVTVESVYVPLSYKDGYRVIVAPLWPLDMYRLAPSAVLRQALYRHASSGWTLSLQRRPETALMLMM